MFMMIDRIPVPPYETRSGPFVSATAPGIGRARYDQKLWNPEPEGERGVPSHLS